MAVAAFRRSDNYLGVLRSRWGLAVAIQRQGHHRTALTRLQEVREEFATFGALGDAALVALDMMETLLALERYRQIRQTAGNIVDLFKEAGIATGALTAADYLKQAAASRRINPSLIDYVRKYLRLVQIQPEIAFVPPPL